MKKNEIYTVKIDDMTFEGFGVARVTSMVLFIANAVLGDELIVKILKVKKTYAYAKIHSFIKKSPLRIESDCEFSQRCGGCVFRNISYEDELKLKQKQIEQTLKRISGIKNLCISQIKPAINCNFYRNKVISPVRKVEGKIRFGFFAANSHNFVPLNSCHLQADIFTKILEHITYWLQKNNVSAYDEDTASGTVRNLYIRSNYELSQILVCLVLNKNKLLYKEELVKSLTSKFKSISGIILNINTKKTNVILGEKFETIYGNDYIYEKLNDMKFKLSVESFFQVNSKQAENLYAKAKELANIKNSEVLLDLYCGTGTIGLSMARKAGKLIGIEINKKAIADAKENAKINNINNANFYCMDAGGAFSKLNQLHIVPDVIILDPPRKGLTNELINDIAKYTKSRIVYISCNVSTLARDLKEFSSYGYKVKQIAPFDMFPRTGHVECIASIAKD